jgi:hypothetical protein
MTITPPHAFALALIFGVLLFMIGAIVMIVPRAPLGMSDDDEPPEREPIPRRPPLNCHDEALLGAWFQRYLSGPEHRLICPDCLGHEWLEGPEAGISQNLYCATPTCGARFNIALIPTPDELMIVQHERIGDSAYTPIMYADAAMHGEAVS